MWILGLKGLKLRYIVTTDGKDGHGLKLEKVGQLFQVSILCL